MPDLPVNSPEMMAFLKNEPPIQCDDVENWVSCGTDRKVNYNLFLHFLNFLSKLSFYLTLFVLISLDH